MTERRPPVRYFGLKAAVAAINAVRGKQSMAEFCREAIAREIARRLERRKGKP